ncbi:hypothetical protein [Paraglaciecola sp. 25GB23A]|uniref:hypothetical protein n=1 Tax=Paraglaciecola sp. 25GB23A TaxID=3156068 RepID=UPI0032AF28C6
MKLLLIMSLVSSCCFASVTSGLKLELSKITDSEIRVSLLNNSAMSVYMPTILEYEYYLFFKFKGGVEPINLGVDHSRIDTNWDYVRLQPNMSVSQKITLPEWYKIPYGECYHLWATYQVPLIENEKLWDGMFGKGVTFWSGKIDSNKIEICF